MTREWRHLKMMKRAGRGHDLDGLSGTPAGVCAVECPACPLPGKNLPPDYDKATLATLKGAATLASTGVFSVDCARHDMKRPCSSGDLRKGER